MSEGEKTPLPIQRLTNPMPDHSQPSGIAIGESGITGHVEIPHVPQKTNPASTAKRAVKARNQACFGLSRIYLMNMIAMIAKTIVKMATVSTMPSAPK